MLALVHPGKSHSEGSRRQSLLFLLTAKGNRLIISIHGAVIGFDGSVFDFDCSGVMT